MRPVIYVVANKGLNMSPGKLAAQVGHAVAMSVLESKDEAKQAWKSSHHRWIIVLEASDAVHLDNIARYLAQREVDYHPIVDEGVNEIQPYSLTAIGLSILDKDSPEAQLLSGLKRYGHDGEPYTDLIKDRDMYKRFYESYRNVTPFEHWVEVTRNIHSTKKLLTRHGNKVISRFRDEYTKNKDSCQSGRMD